jgi:hypothetical protein
LTELLDDVGDNMNRLEVNGVINIDFEFESDVLENVLPFEAVPAIIELIYCSDYFDMDRNLFMNRVMVELTLYTKEDFAVEYVNSRNFNRTLALVSRTIEFKRKNYGNPIIIGWNNERVAVAAHINVSEAWIPNPERGLLFEEELPDFNKQPHMV